jgi:hypothetical protein
MKYPAPVDSSILPHPAKPLESLFLSQDGSCRAAPFGKISWIISTPVQPGARQAVRPVSEVNPEALIGDFLLD